LFEKYIGLQFFVVRLQRGTLRRSSEKSTALPRLYFISRMELIAQYVRSWQQHAAQTGNAARCG
jgi:hypothetical protein